MVGIIGVTTILILNKSEQSTGGRPWSRNITSYETAISISLRISRCNVTGVETAK
jgi:hypothetical protein